MKLNHVDLKHAYLTQPTPSNDQLTVGDVMGDMVPVG